MMSFEGRVPGVPEDGGQCQGAGKFYFLKFVLL